MSDEMKISKWDIQKWIERAALEKEEFLVPEWAGDTFAPNLEQIEDLVDRLQPVVDEWLDRHELRVEYRNPKAEQTPRRNEMKQQKTIDEMIAVMEAARDGKTIERLRIGNDRDENNWLTCIVEPFDWNWAEYDYRVKFEPKFYQLVEIKRVDVPFPFPLRKAESFSDPVILALPAGDDPAEAPILKNAEWTLLGVFQEVESAKEE